VTDLAERRLIEAREFTSSDEYPPVPTRTSEQVRPALVISMNEMHRRENLSWREQELLEPVVDVAQRLRREQDVRAAEKRQRIAQREAAETLARRGLPVPDNLARSLTQEARPMTLYVSTSIGQIRARMDELLADEWTDWIEYESLVEKLLKVEA
jgi:tryptophan 2,3-dioxygenase